MRVFTFTIALLTSLGSFAQINDGSRILTFNLDNFSAISSKSVFTYPNNPDNISKASGLGLNGSVLYGRLRNNALFSYGIQVGIDFTKSSNNLPNSIDNKTHSINFGPVLSYQKFYSITSHLIFSPYSTLAMNYNRYNNEYPSGTDNILRTYVIGAALHPFSITFTKSAKTLFLFSIGSIALQYSHAKSFTKPSSNSTSETVYNNIGFTAQTTGISVGIQKVL